MRRCCRNCRKSRCIKVDLGEFGMQDRYVCRENLERPAGGICMRFEPVYDHAMIEKELLDDIRDPAVCGAKEPKIAALLWVLHDDGVPTVADKIRQIFGR